MSEIDQGRRNFMLGRFVPVQQDVIVPTLPPLIPDQEMFDIFDAQVETLPFRDFNGGAEVTDEEASESTANFISDENNPGRLSGIGISITDIARRIKVHVDERARLDGANNHRFNGMCPEETVMNLFQGNTTMFENVRYLISQNGTLVALIESAKYAGQVIVVMINEEISTITGNAGTMFRAKGRAGGIENRLIDRKGFNPATGEQFRHELRLNFPGSCSTHTVPQPVTVEEPVPVGAGEPQAAQVVVQNPDPATGGILPEGGTIGVDGNPGQSGPTVGIPRNTEDGGIPWGAILGASGVGTLATVVTLLLIRMRGDFPTEDPVQA